MCLAAPVKNSYDASVSPIAFLKMYSTRCAQQTAIDAVQIFGGRGVTQTGMGRLIEHVRSNVITRHAIANALQSTIVQCHLMHCSEEVRSLLL